MSISSRFNVVHLKDYVYFQEGPGIRNSQNTSEGVRFLNIRCFIDGRLDTESMKRISEAEAFGKYKHFLLDSGDYVVSSSGTLGRVAEVYPEDLPVMLNTSTIRFRSLDESKLDRLYLRYFLESEVFQQQVRLLATGSVQLNYGPSHLARVEMPLPNIEAQRAIGKFLDELTRKIRLNVESSKTLEDIARELFKSWFIDFDPVKSNMAGERPFGMNDSTAALFPMSFEDSELGPIPKGWSVRSFEELVVKQKVGQVYSSKNSSKKGKVPILDQKESGKIGFHDDPPGYVASPEEPVVVFGNHTCTLRLIPFPFSVIQNVFPLLSEKANIFWLFFALQGKQDYEGYKGHWPDFILHKIKTPRREVTDKFGELVKPLFQKIWTLEAETSSLSEVRDSLLPRLISGQLHAPKISAAS
jgi:type I restriction enzyme S subunit